jgi:hypothetical protein
MKWKASMRFDGGEAVSEAALLARQLGLGFGRGVGGEGRALFAAMNHPADGQQSKRERRVA